MKTRILQFTKWALSLLAVMLILPDAVLAQEDSTAFIANADTYLRSTSPDNSANYGTKTIIYVRNSTSAYQQLGLIRFDASSFDLPASVQLDSAKVYLTVGGVLNTAINVSLISVTDDNWDENSITWDSYKNDGPDTIATVATSYVAAKQIRYSWDVTNYLREELVTGNKIVSLAVFQDYNTGANTTFIAHDSITDNQNKPLLALFTHAVPVKVVYLTPTLNRATSSITLNWKTPAEQNTSYAVVQRSTDGSNFTDISSHLSVQGVKTDTTTYTFTDNSAIAGYTNYYRIKFVMTDNSTYLSDIVSQPFFVQIETQEDSYVQLANNGTNHGTETKFLVKNDGNSSYSRIAFLKFDLSGISGTPQAGKLHLTINSANSGIGSTSWYLWNINDDSWSENTITGKNYPDMSDSSQIIATEPGRSTGSVDFNIPVNVIRDALAADGILSLAITSDNKGSTDDVSFVSRDSSNNEARPIILISEDPADNVTPVSLSKLTARISTSGIDLSWKAFTELNSERFDVQRSADGHIFEVIGNVKGRGTATTAKSYEYKDVTPLRGMNYYRLKVLDKNGEFSYSNIAAINAGTDSNRADWKLYPNPVHSGQTIHLSLEKLNRTVTIRIMDATGRILKIQNQAESKNLTVSTSGFAPGIYYIQLLNGDGQQIGQRHKILIK